MRGSRGDHAPAQHRWRWPEATATRPRRQARRDGLDRQRTTHRLELAHVGLGEVYVAGLATAEPILGDADDRLAYIDIMVSYVASIDNCRLINDNIVYDAWAAPAAPPRPADEANPSPGRTARPNRGPPS